MNSYLEQVKEINTHPEPAQNWWQFLIPGKTNEPCPTTQNLSHKQGFPGGTSGKEPACQCRKRKGCQVDLWVKKIPWRRAWQPTAIFSSGESHGWRSLAG